MAKDPHRDKVSSIQGDVKTYWRRLQCNIFFVFQDVLQTRLEDVLQRRLEDALEDENVLRWRRLEDVLENKYICPSRESLFRNTTFHLLDCESISKKVRLLLYSGHSPEPSDKLLKSSFSFLHTLLFLKINKLLWSLQIFHRAYSSISNKVWLNKFSYPRGPFFHLLFCLFFIISKVLRVTSVKKQDEIENLVLTTLYEQLVCAFQHNFFVLYFFGKFYFTISSNISLLVLLIYWSEICFDISSVFRGLFGAIFSLLLVFFSWTQLQHFW